MNGLIAYGAAKKHADDLNISSSGNNLALGKGYTATSPHATYPDHRNALTNGRRAATFTLTDNGYVGWINTKVEIIVDLAAILNVKSVIVFGVSDTYGSVALPSEIEVLTSTDGVNYTSQETKNPTAAAGLYFYLEKIDFATVMARYVKIICTRNVSYEWIFLDEIEIY